MRTCFAKNCSNSLLKGYVMVRFPKDEHLREKWCVAVGMSKLFHPSANDRLCDVHFERSQWEKYRCQLKSDAVPTLFCNCTLAIEKEILEISTETQEQNSPVHLSDHQYSVGHPKVVKVKLPNAIHHQESCFLSKEVNLVEKKERHAVAVPVPPLVIIKQEGLRAISSPYSKPKDEFFAERKQLLRENELLKKKVSRLKRELTIKTKLLEKKERELRKVHFKQPVLANMANNVVNGPFNFPPGTILLVQDVDKTGSSSASPVTAVPVKPVSLSHVLPSSSLLTLQNQKGGHFSVPPKTADSNSNN